MKKIFSKQSIVFIALAASVGALFLGCGYAFILYRKAQGQAVQSESLIQKMRQEQNRLVEERNKIEKDNQKLQADAVSYLGINSKLQESKDAASKQLDETKKILERKEGQIQRIKLELEEVTRSAQDKKDSAQDAAEMLSQEALKKKLSGLQSTLQKERALYYYNLGVAYAKAKLYKEAEASYEKSLELEPVNAEAHYNLGLLYDNYEYDPYRAKRHLIKYLELKPEALDKDEVESWIKKISTGID